jgi:hypothetical protein
MSGTANISLVVKEDMPLETSKSIACHSEGVVQLLRSLKFPVRFTLKPLDSFLFPIIQVFGHEPLEQVSIIVLEQAHPN